MSDNDIVEMRQFQQDELYARITELEAKLERAREALNLCALMFGRRGIGTPAEVHKALAAIDSPNVLNKIKAETLREAKEMFDLEDEYGGLYIHTRLDDSADELER